MKTVLLMGFVIVVCAVLMYVMHKLEKSLSDEDKKAIAKASENSVFEDYL